MFVTVTTHMAATSHWHPGWNPAFDNFNKAVDAAVQELLEAQNRQLESDMGYALLLQDDDYLDRLHIVSQHGYPPAAASKWDIDYYEWLEAEVLND